MTAKYVTGAAFAATLSAAAFFAGAATHAQTWDEIVAAANAEGTVSFYNNLQPNGIEPLLAEFQKEYPKISVESLRLGSNPLIERFATEFAAGRHLTDVLITFPDQRITDGLAAGWMMEFVPPEFSNFPEDIATDNKIYTLQYSREAIIWNKSLVKGDDEPKEWTDLFDPKWKGKVGMNPPWRSVSIQQIVAYWEDIGIADAAQKLKDNDVRFFEGSGGIIQAVLRGDVALAEMTDLPLNPLLADGAPVGWVYPESGTTMSANRAFVAANAPHPNAAKVFLNWLMSEKGQIALQIHAGLSATRNGLPPLSHLPTTADLPKVVDGEAILTPERQASIVNHWRTVFGIQ
ncbi:ABC transporter substrate-binding protein [Paracoccus sp. (in: a-proteobacteria)]|uniref:ABC transporter substrate-binding protein n=1 Tax=Paracoccus sp. TaxID=267 RepID=UPI002AFF61C6|nr:extracellular solute-binding protein [Paracoccus sp. (in: a-proteobacteria)]